MTNQQVLDRSLSLSESDWQRLMDRLAAEQRPAVDADAERRRKDRTRHPFIKRAAMRVMHADGRNATHIVRTRNLSVSGVAVVHGGYLYDGTRCAVILQNRHGEGVALLATTVWARHLQGQSHELGLRFDKTLELADFIDNGSPAMRTVRGKGSGTGVQGSGPNE